MMTSQLGRREGSGLTARYSKGINAYQPVLPELARICMAKKKQAGSVVCTLCTWVVNKITKKKYFSISLNTNLADLIAVYFFKFKFNET